MLAFSQTLFHAVNHAVDIGESTPGWIGPLTVLELSVLALLMAWLLRRAARTAS